jgi:hypothetical protein
VANDLGLDLDQLLSQNRQRQVCTGRGSPSQTRREISQNVAI